MTDLRKAAEMALDALRLYVTMYPQMDKHYMVEARETLRQATAQPEPTPRQLQRIRQRAWQGIKQDEYKFDPEVCFAMGFDVGYGAVASKVEPSQEECGGFDSRPAPLKEWVGLTDEERHAYTQSPFTEENYRAIESRLKEKNG